MVVLRRTLMTKHSDRARREFVSVVELVILMFVICIPVAIPLMPARAATTHTVGMYNFYFDKQFLTVAPGDSVIWHNYGSMTHTSTSNTSAWDTGDVSPGTSSAAILIPTTPGNYTYHCFYHSGYPYYMYGSIIVSTSIPEFSDSIVVVVGMLAIAIGLMFVRGKH